MWIDLHDGPLVAETPPASWVRSTTIGTAGVVDIGMTSPDKGQGGKYLTLPPGYDGEVPEAYIVVRPNAFEMFMAWRTFPDTTGDLQPQVQVTTTITKVYPLSQAGKPPAMKFVNIFPEPFVTVGPGEYQFWDLLNGVVQSEPPSTADPVTLGFFASIGIEHGKTLLPCSSSMPPAPRRRWKPRWLAPVVTFRRMRSPSRMTRSFSGGPYPTWRRIPNLFRR